MASVLFLALCLGCLTVGMVMGQERLSQSDKEEALVAHNRFRGIVNPSASDMQIMEWSDELARVAQNYAQQCIFAHNPDRQSQQSTFSFVGENLFASSGAANFTNFVQGWYDEVAAYDYDSNSCRAGAVCGHYTQVVWAASRSLGCGAYRCPVLQNIDGNNWVTFVCNYGPAGNFNGRSPYSAGTSCSSCGENLPFCVNNLCSAERSPAGVPSGNGGVTSVAMLSQRLLVAVVIMLVALLY